MGLATDVTGVRFSAGVGILPSPPYPQSIGAHPVPHSVGARGWGELPENEADRVRLVSGLIILEYILASCAIMCLFCFKEGLKEGAEKSQNNRLAQPRFEPGSTRMQV